VLIASSATGGHIYPALAIADEIMKRDPDAEILFVCSKWDIGKDIVNNAGYRQEFVDVSGFYRKNLFKNFSVFAGLARASKEIRKILRDFRPELCIGTGGHVSGFVIRAAAGAGVRAFIQEQNVIPGLANKLAEKYADRIYAGFEDTVGYFKDPGKVIVSGNPIRPAFSESAARRMEFRAKYGVPEGAFCTLIFGGSQGADAINDAALDLFCRYDASGVAGYEKPWNFIFITGRELYGKIKTRLASLLPAEPGWLTMMDYSDAIQELYAAADLIVSRAGALTVTEIAGCGKASILIPSPNVTNNHQYYNAKTLESAGAAVLLSEEDVRDGRLAAVIKRLAADTEMLDEMGKKAGKLARADSVKVIVDGIYRS